MTNRFTQSFLGRRGTAALAGVALLAAGGGAGAVAVAMTRPSATMAPATPVAIRTLSSDGIVTIRGRVAEVFGTHFILADATGRALVDAGRDTDVRVAAGQPLTVQGRYDDGFLHAGFLVDAAGKVTQVGPIGGPPHDRHGPGGRHDRDGGPDRRGPDGDRAPPPLPRTPAPASPSSATPPAAPSH